MALHHKERKMDIKVMDMPILDTSQAKDFIGDIDADIVLAVLAYVAHNEWRKAASEMGL